MPPGGCGRVACRECHQEIPCRVRVPYSREEVSAGYRIDSVREWAEGREALSPPCNYIMPASPVCQLRLLPDPASMVLQSHVSSQSLKGCRALEVADGAGYNTRHASVSVGKGGDYDPRTAAITHHVSPDGDHSRL